MARSSSSHRSITGFQRSSFGAARAGTFLAGGTAEASAWRTSRRWTRKRRDSDLMLKPSRS
jgi:hypothetical protein